MGGEGAGLLSVPLHDAVVVQLLRRRDHDGVLLLGDLAEGGPREALGHVTHEARQQLVRREAAEGADGVLHSLGGGVESNSIMHKVVNIWAFEWPLRSVTQNKSRISKLSTKHNSTSKPLSHIGDVFPS